MFSCLLLMRHCDTIIVSRSVDVFVFGAISASIKRVIGLVHLLLLILIFRGEARVGNFLALCFQILSHVRVVRHHAVLMRSNALNVGISSLIVDLALVVLLLLQVHLVPLHHTIVLIASLLHLVSELRMLLSNSDLFLQPLLLVMQFPETILEHLCLDLLLFHV
mgnify:CR=1 FL=1